jgi:hypothetical protein
MRDYIPTFAAAEAIGARILKLRCFAILICSALFISPGQMICLNAEGNKFRHKRPERSKGYSAWSGPRRTDKPLNPYGLDRSSNDAPDRAPVGSIPWGLAFANACPDFA